MPLNEHDNPIDSYAPCFSNSRSCDTDFSFFFSFFFFIDTRVDTIKIGSDTSDGATLLSGITRRITLHSGVLPALVGGHKKYVRTGFDYNTYDQGQDRVGTTRSRLVNSISVYRILAGRSLFYTGCSLKVPWRRGDRCTRMRFRRDLNEI